MIETIDGVGNMFGLLHLSFINVLELRYPGPHLNDGKGRLMRPPCGGMRMLVVAVAWRANAGL